MRAASHNPGHEQAHTARVRLDKWLWAARFFTTRSIAKTAIESGHVRHQGERCKVGKEIAPGAILTVRRGYDEIEIEVRGVSDQRRGAPEARLLYEETSASQQRRAQREQDRKLAVQPISEQRPTKQQRRVLQKFRKSWE